MRRNINPEEIGTNNDDTEVCNFLRGQPQECKEYEESEESEESKEIPVDPSVIEFNRDESIHFAFSPRNINTPGIKGFSRTVAQVQRRITEDNKNDTKLLIENGRITNTNINNTTVYVINPGMKNLLLFIEGTAFVFEQDNVLQFRQHDLYTMCDKMNVTGIAPVLSTLSNSDEREQEEEDTDLITHQSQQLFNFINHIKDNYTRLFNNSEYLSAMGYSSGATILVEALKDPSFNMEESSKIFKTIYLIAPITHVCQAPTSDERKTLIDVHDSHKRYKKSSQLPRQLFISVLEPHLASLQTKFGSPSFGFLLAMTCALQMKNSYQMKIEGKQLNGAHLHVFRDDLFYSDQMRAYEEATSNEENPQHINLEIVKCGGHASFWNDPFYRAALAQHVLCNMQQDSAPTIQQNLSSSSTQPPSLSPQSSNTIIVSPISLFVGDAPSTPTRSSKQSQTSPSLFAIWEQIPDNNKISLNKKHPLSDDTNSTQKRKRTSTVGKLKRQRTLRTRTININL